MEHSNNPLPPAVGSEGGGVQDATTHVGPAVRMSGHAKTLGYRTELHPFELTIEPGEIHALLGQNGSGKSTLIKILSGFHTPDAGGNCWVRSEELVFGSPQASFKSGLRFVHQELGLVASSTVLDNLAFTAGFPTTAGTIRGKVALEHATKSLTGVGLEVSPMALVASLTPAQRTGVAVARAIDFAGGSAVAVVLDEPTATLPTEEVEHLHSMLRTAAGQGVGILYVTHHLDEVFRLADRVSVLRDGFLVESCRVSEIDRATIVHRLVGSELESVHRTPTDGRSYHSSGTVFSIDNLHTEFINGVSMTARSGEIVGIYGLTGSGRESLLGSSFGSLPRQSGTVKVDDRIVEPFSPRKAMSAGIGYLSPDRKVSGGFIHMTAAENLTMANLRPFFKGGFLRTDLEMADASGWFERLQVRPAGAIRSILGTFSGGNQQKIVLGKWLRNNPRVLLLDEPTQGVDVGAKAELHRQILAACEAGAVVVVSSSDVEELASLCDRVLIMRSGNIAAELVGEAVNEVEINRSFHGVS